MSNRVCYHRKEILNTKEEHVILKYYTDGTLELEYSMLNEDKVSQNDIFMTFTGENPMAALDVVLSCLIGISLDN